MPPCPPPEAGVGGVPIEPDLLPEGEARIEEGVRLLWSLSQPGNYDETGRAGDLAYTDVNAPPATTLCYRVSAL